MKRVMKRLLFAVTSVFLISACSDDSTDYSNANKLDPDVPPVTAGDWYRPAPETTWQLQLQGTVNTGYDVTLFDIDLFDSPVELIADLQFSGKKVICYFSAGSYEEWRSDADAFHAADKGNALEGWPGERWLDIRSANVQKIMQSRLDLAVEKGCDGVDLDNMDVYTNSPGFALSASEQLAYNRFLANEAHARSLSVGLKNDLGQIESLVEYFDFAINEQCFIYDECDLLSTFIVANKPVFHVEYAVKYVNNTAGARDDLCLDSAALQFSTLVMPQLLDDTFRFSCL